MIRRFRPRTPALRVAAMLTALGALACAGREPAREPAPGLSTTVRPVERFEGALGAELRAAAPDEPFRVLVDLTDRIDRERLGAWVLGSNLPRRERRDAVVDVYERVAARQQDALRPWLDAAVESGRLDYWRGVAVVNRLLVEGSAAGILELSARPEVATVRPDWSSNRRAARATEGGLGLGETFVSWAIEAVGADRLWAAGLSGRTVHVAAIDTGVRASHEQLAGRMAEAPGGFFDPVEGRGRPWDSHWHGTGILAVAVGGNPVDRSVGLAPGARWSMALANYRNYYSRWRMTLAADWVFRRARPDVLVNAWSHDEAPCTTFDLPFIDAWQAAGIFVIFPAGNAGPRPASGEAPAQLADTAPAGDPVFAVGGTAPGGDLYSQSSRGPSPCGERAFPTLVLPGAELPHAHSSGDDHYVRSDGTSFSAGLMAGAAALLLEAAPELEPWELGRLLTETARDRRPEGPDDDSGAGELDLPAAFDRLKREGRVRPEFR